MKPFDYTPVRSVDEACVALGEHDSDASILAGGTDLLIEWRRPVGKTPRVVVDISHIQDLKGIVVNDGMVLLKPLTTHTEIMTSAVIREGAPFLTSAASNIGAPQIRNRGTVGGNIMNAATCADTVPPLIALGATVTLESKAGLRRMDLVNLYVKPYHTNARPEEVLTEIRFAKLPPRTRSSFIKLGRRNALAISRLSVAVTLSEDENGKIIDARIVPGAAFPVWRRVTEAEHMLIGEKSSSPLFAACGRKISEMMIAQSGRRWSTEYKEPVIAVLVRRALERCASLDAAPNGVGL